MRLEEVTRFQVVDLYLFHIKKRSCSWLYAVFVLSSAGVRSATPNLVGKQAFVGSGAFLAQRAPQCLRYRLCSATSAVLQSACLGSFHILLTLPIGTPIGYARYASCQKRSQRSLHLRSLESGTSFSTPYGHSTTFET